MKKALAQRLAPAAVGAALVIGLAAGPARAHSDWGLPLVGGLVGGYGLSYMMNRDRDHERAPAPAPAPTYVAVPAAPAAAPAAAPSAASSAAAIEHQLNVLDDLAAKGYITKDEYQSRRQALLNQL
jgi:hypothetical protein